MGTIDSTFNAAFISTDEFGVGATFKVNGTGGGTSIEGNFFNEGDIPGFEAGEVEETGPMFMAESSDLTGADHDSILIIDGTTYYVTSVRIDGEGMTEVKLSEQKVT